MSIEQVDHHEQVAHHDQLTAIRLEKLRKISDLSDFDMSNITDEQIKTIKDHPFITTIIKNLISRSGEKGRYKKIDETVKATCTKFTLRHNMAAGEKARGRYYCWKRYRAKNIC